MTKIAILPIATDQGSRMYHAVAGDTHASGATAGAALDALAAQLPAAEARTLLVVLDFHPDQYFSAAQQARLNDLMSRWRQTRDSEESLPPHEQAELETLIAQELQAATDRAAALVDHSTP
jgi:hypothetical protein